MSTTITNMNNKSVAQVVLVARLIVHPLHRLATKPFVTQIRAIAKLLQLLHQAIFAQVHSRSMVKVVQG